MLNLLVIIRDALIHPTQLLLNMHRGQHRYRHVLLALALWIGFWWLVIGCSLMLFFQAHILIIAFVPILAVLLIFFPSGIAIAFGTTNYTRYKVADGLYLTEPVFVQNSYYIFWPIRMQIAWFPSIFGLTALFFRYSNFNNLRMFLVFLAVLLLTGCLISSFFIVVYASMPTMLSMRIWLGLMFLWMIIGSLPMIGIIWFSSIFFLTGLWIGIVRPLSWLWQSLVSLIISCLVRFAREPWRWWRYHPALYDELGLLPLVGLSWSLRQLYHLDPDRGFKALIAVYRLSAQRTAVRHAIKRLLHDPRSAASLFWQLSADPQGIVLLRQLNQHWRSLHPLIKHFTACTHVQEPQAWPALMTTLEPALAAYATLPAIKQLNNCLQVLATILRSTYAQPAYQALHSYNIEPRWLLEQAIMELQTQHRLEPEQPLGLPPTGGLLTGWPRHVLLSTIEQLNFLQILAKQQG